MCTGNTIKPMAGNNSTCSTSCDGKMKVANTEHTACGMSIVNSHLSTKTYPNKSLCFRHSNHNKWLKIDICWSTDKGKKNKVDWFSKTDPTAVKLMKTLSIEMV